MEELGVDHYAETLCRELCKKLKHATLFVDRNMTECLHWNGGFSRLLANDVKCVKELSPFEKAPKTSSKAIFLVSSLLTNVATKKTIRLIIENSEGALDYCIVVTIASHQAHVAASNKWREPTTMVSDGRRIFDEFEAELLSWMGNRNYTSEVLHIPFFTGHLAEDVFLTVPFGDFTPKLESIYFHSDFWRLHADEQCLVEVFSSCWNSLFTALNIKEDIYCVGPMSSLVGTHLTNYPAAKNRRKSATNHLSLILIDRTADLIAPLVCVELSAIDNILISHKTLPNHHSERAVLLPNDAENVPPFTVFEHCQNKEARNLIQHFIEKPLNGVLEIAVKCLDPLRKTYSLPRLSTKQSYEKQLETLLSALQQSEKFDYPPIYQICGSLSKAIKENGKVTDIMEIMSEMELLYQHSNAVDQFLQFSSEKSLTFDTDIRCLIMLYSLAAGNSLKWQTDELELFLVSKLIQEKPSDPIFIQTGAQAVVRNVIVKLKNVARLRDVLPSQKRSTPYVVDLFERIFDPKQALPELACKTSGLADVLKSSFSLLMNVTKSARPNDAKTIVIFIIGGLCCYEIAALRRKLKELKILEHNVILGSTRLITGNDIMNSFLVDLSED